MEDGTGEKSKRERKGNGEIQDGTEKNKANTSVCSH